MWPVTIVAVAVIAGIVVLAMMDKDVSSLVTFALAALGGLIYGKVDQVKEMANGQMSRFHDTVDKLTEQLAKSVPADSVGVDNGNHA